MRRVGAVTRTERPVRHTGAVFARVLFGLAILLGLGAPLLVATDVVQPIALFDEPGWVAGGAAVLLLGTALLLSAQACLADQSLMALMPTKTDKGNHLQDLHALVQQGVDSGAFSPAVSVDVAVMLIKGAILSLTFGPPSEPKLPREQIADGIIDLLRGRRT